MPTPDFVLELREKIGHAPLWLPGVGAVVYNEAGQVLLGRRADNGRWTIITGMVDPGEEPAQAMRREVYEETGVDVEVEVLLNVGVVGPITFPNGDVCTFLNLDFRCRYLGGEARVNDDESLDVGWFALDALPELNPRHRELVLTAAAADGVPTFHR
ncbi:NUDIX domain-containing protein [Arthrobacter sp. MSA 4-2]|uniref:NUDIX hydrolase n=1 Tax=Arthrobacter sp. MSA 4-2 TaxID=2794349 RepID=UPI0018E6EE95|nr:NUDIX domain-containing protein [Arthrobacter sp. MSA 4-2]MBJ2119633.1 NUDIX domain-containing protein [Arthrobacter sp. MSA 4-2]